MGKRIWLSQKRKRWKEMTRNGLKRVGAIAVALVMVLQGSALTMDKAFAETETTTPPPKTLQIEWRITIHTRTYANMTSHINTYFDPPYNPSTKVNRREQVVKFDFKPHNVNGSSSTINSAKLNGSSISDTEAQNLLNSIGAAKPGYAGIRFSNASVTETYNYPVPHLERIVHNVPLEFDINDGKGNISTKYENIDFKWNFPESQGFISVSSFTPVITQGPFTKYEELVPESLIATDRIYLFVPMAYTIPSTPVTKTYNPIIKTNPDVVKTLEDAAAVDWNEGITATWGKTTAKTIPSDGSITDQTITGTPKTDAKLSSDGTKFDRVGWAKHTYRIKDSSGDSTFTDTDRKLIVKTNKSPELKAYYHGTTDAYGGEWLSGNVSADASRKKSLDIVAKTDVPGTSYDTTVFKGAAEHGFTTGNQHTVSDYKTDSATAAGDDFTAQLLGTGDHSIILSPKSASINVKMDSVIPTVKVTSADNWVTAKDESTDALSGIDKTYVRFVKAGDPAPAIDGSPEWKAINAGTSISTNLIAGNYDVYFYAVDKATNKSAVTAGPTGVKVASTEKARISASYDKNGVPENYVSDTWINKDVTIKVSKPLAFVNNGTDVFGAVYEGATLKNKAAAPDGDGIFVHSNESIGSEYHGFLLDSTDSKMTAASDKIKVKLDKTNPLPNVTSNDNWTTAKDESTDALSGVDKAYVRFVKAGSPAPTADGSPEWKEINAGGNISPNLIPGNYDVYFYAVDKATNESAVAPGPTDVKIISSEKALISATYDKNGTPEDYVSGTWTNKPVTVKVKKPLAFINNGSDVFGAVYEAMTLKNKAITPDGEGVFVHNGESAGTDYHGYLLDANDNKMSAASDTIKVKVDLTKPVAKVKFNKGTPDFKFTDVSTDKDSPVNANSGVNAAKTKLALVKSGEPAPAASEYKDIATVELPADGHYDVYAETEDNAGNPSDRNLVLKNISRDGKDQIKAEDFMYGIKQGNLTDEQAKALARVWGKYYGGDEIPFADMQVDAPSLIAVNAKIASGEKGEFTLTFKTPAVNPNVPSGDVTTKSIDIKVTLTDNGNTNMNNPADPQDDSERIYANNFGAGINNGKLSPDDVKHLASAKAFTKDNKPMPDSQISVDQSQLDALNGAIENKEKGAKYPITFKTPDGTSVTVEATLFDAGSATPQNNNEDSVLANNFNYGIDEPDLTDAIAKKLSDVVALDKFGNNVDSNQIGVDAGELKAIVDAQHDKKPGEYPLTFKYNNKSVTIKVTLKDHGMLDSASKDHITANDFGYGFDEPSLTDMVAKIRSSVAAKDLVTKKDIDTSNISVEVSELDAINNAHASKSKVTLPLTFKTPNGTAVTVKVKLYDKTSAGQGAAHLSGNNFDYGVDEPDLNDVIAKTLSGVNGRDDNGMPIKTDDISVDAAQLKDIVDGQHDKKLGDYPLTFKSPDGTSITVTVTLKSHGKGDPGKASHITANDFIYGIDEGNLTDVKAKVRSLVKAADKDGNPIDPANISVDADELAAINTDITANKTGDYPLSFSTPDGVKVTVNVALRDHSKDPDINLGKGNLGGNNFDYDNGNGKLTPDKAKELAKIVGKDVNGNDVPLSDITADQGNLDTVNDKIMNNEPGTFPIKFTGKDGAEIVVNVTLKQSDEEISAKDFTYKNKDGVLSPEKAKELAKVKAKDFLHNDIPLKDIIVDAAQLKDLNDAIKSNKGGVFKLTFSTAKGKKAEISITLVKKAVPAKINTGDNSNMMLYAFMLIIALSSLIGCVVYRRRADKRA